MIREFARKHLVDLLKFRKSFVYQAALEDLKSGKNKILPATVELLEPGKLGASGDRLVMPLDGVIFPAVVKSGSWQGEEIDFLKSKVQGEDEYCLIDIGANVGLFTRQVLESGLKLKNCFCLEPNAQNFSCLVQNLDRYQNVECFNFGLGDTSARQEFYADHSNCGNYSLNIEAMGGRSYSTEVVTITSVADFFAETKPRIGASNIIWKSDTQGYDELIVSLVPMDVWSRISFAIIELWRIGKPDFDRIAFEQRISMFPNLAIGSKPRKSTGEVFDYLNGRDRAHQDLYLWK